VVLEVLFEDPDDQPEDGPGMEFRLTYEGELLSTQNDPTAGRLYKPGQRENRHNMRRAFHAQLRDLWERTPFLKSGQRSGPGALIIEDAGGRDETHYLYDRDTLASRHAHYGFNFVPLVTKSLDLICGLDVLFLRPDKPGDLVWRGDIDNRIKTLIDALKIPEANEDYSSRAAADDEKPMFCLLEDDRLITKLAVETDQLLDAPKNQHVKLTITVRLRPMEMHLANMQFG